VLPPGSTVITNQVYLADSRTQAQVIQPSYQQAAPLAIAMTQQQPQSYTEPAPVMSQPISRQPSQLSLEQAPTQSRPSSSFGAPSKQAVTNLLSHTDGSMMVQEVFLTSGQINELGSTNVLDLQGLWARIRLPNNGHQLRLSLRMVNQQSIPIHNIQIRFQPNSFGLIIDPSLDPIKAQLAPGQPETVNVTLIGTPENQTIPTEPSDIASLTMQIRYTIGNQTLVFTHTSPTPIHIFFQDQHQETKQGWNPNRPLDVTLLSCSDEGPRLTQSKFLELWPSEPFQKPEKSWSLQIQGIGWPKWYQHFSSIGVLDDIRPQNHQHPAPSTREVIRIWEHKLSMNRVYVVASREVDVGAVQPDLVFFVSLRLGGMNEGGQLVLGEVRVKAQDGWQSAEVQLRGSVNQRLWPPLERALRAVLLS
jgi:hypothetical protein